jgi:peptidoglycan/LPS O-acetylase OafA/YrhL
MRLGEVARGRDNNFNLIRMIAATGVLVSHAFPITLGTGTPQPLEAETGYTLGWICVAVFFAISGFLITASFERKREVAPFISARIARLFPALIVVTLLTAFFYGPAFTTLGLGAYFSDIGTWTYVPRNVTLVKLQYGLPGVFADHPYPVAINGSLWTLFHEVTCYVGVLLAGLTGLLASRRILGAVLLAYAAVFIVTGLDPVESMLPERIHGLRLLSFPFAVGSAFFIWRDRIVLSWLVAVGLGVLAWLVRGTAVYEAIFLSFIAYATFVVAYRPSGWLRSYNRLGDYSYGMYVYAFPVQQAVVALAGPMTPLQNIAASLPVTLAFAVASWYLVEEPALARRHRLSGWLENLRGNRIIRHRPEEVEG